MAGGSWINTGEGGVIPNIYIQERISLRKLVQGYLDTVMKTVIFQWENSWRKRKKVILEHSN